MLIKASLKDFYVAGTSVEFDIPLSWADFVRSTSTVGRDVSWTSGVSPTYLRHERTWRQAMLYSGLRSTSSGSTSRLRRTDVYETLDASEKGAMSFFLGQATAKYVAEVVFGCVVFAHLDSALRHMGVPVGGSRPDFIGLCGDGRVLVVEAKGRSNGLGSVLTEAKHQVSHLPSAPGTSEIRYAHASYFAAAELRVALLDPGSASVDEVDREALIKAHYGSIIALLDESRSVLGRSVQSFSSEATGTSISLTQDVLDDYRSLEAGDLDADGMLLRLRQRREQEHPLMPAHAGRSHFEAILDTVESRFNRNSFEIHRDVQMPQDVYELASESSDRRLIMGPDESVVELDGRWNQDLMSREVSDRAKE